MSPNLIRKSTVFGAESCRLMVVVVAVTMEIGVEVGEVVGAGEVVRLGEVEEVVVMRMTKMKILQ